MDAIRVLLVDDHTLFRQGIASLLREHRHISLVGEAGDGLEAVKQARQLMPDVILMDIYLPGWNGVQAAATIKKEMPSTQIIVLTVSERNEDLFAAVKAGARGYVLKSAGVETLLQGICNVADGQAIVPPAMAAKLLDEFAHIQASNAEQTKGTGEELTEREREVLKLLAHGASNKQIADVLCIAENTVKSHLRNIMDKLHIQNRIQAATFAVREGLYDASAETGDHASNVMPMSPKVAKKAVPKFAH